MLTHDVDVITLREVPLTSRTFWGFSYRSTVVNAGRVLSKDLSLVQYFDSLVWSALSPICKAGLIRDPWYNSFLRMIDLEREYGVRSTLFLISLYGAAGHTPDGRPAPSNRSAHYRLEDWREKLLTLRAEGWELGVHGIDCHISVESARAEREAFSRVLGVESPGLRMHWLYRSNSLRSNAKKAGFAYDSSLGWNDKVGFPEGHYAPFIDRASGLPVVPLNIQDGALLGDWRQGLSSREAWKRISALMCEARERRAVLTVLWHSNSFGVPRFWEDTYVRILEKALADGARILRAIDVVEELLSGNVTQDDCKGD